MAKRDSIKVETVADMVNVCRCEDCEYYIPFNTVEGECDYHGITRWYSDYCSDGQRRCDNG